VTLSADLEFALHLADVADPIALAGFRRAAVRTKADGTFVTEADEAVERALRAEIAAAYPDDAILGEEEGFSPARAGSRRWILDPIDGTHNYVWGIPVWGALIALEADGEIVAGVVSAPALGERYDAARGAGARRNRERIRVSEVASLGEARVGHSSINSFARHGYGDGFASLIDAAHTSRGLGDFWGHMLVASGSLDVMVEPVVNVWDVAALLVIVEEAGGRATGLRGEPLIDAGTILTTNGHLHDEAVARFA
jgi:histidinol-phosphatase